MTRCIKRFARNRESHGGSSILKLKRSVSSSTGGLVSGTGIAGFTLGGGIGWLVRKYGLALDNLVSVDVVTANSELLTASMSEHTDLFWGIRGGGGNFGIVTSFEYQLHLVGPVILGGLIVYRAEDGPALLRFYRDFVKDAPDELTTLFVYLTAPPLPFLPKEVHGKHLVAIVLCYCGKVEDGQRVLAPLRKFGKPIADLIQPLPYAALQNMLDEAAPAGMQNYWKSAYISGLHDEVIDLVLAYGDKITSPFSAIHLHQLGGAMQRIGDDATAFSHRDSAFCAQHCLSLEGTFRERYTCEVDERVLCCPTEIRHRSLRELHGRRRHRPSEGSLRGGQIRTVSGPQEQIRPDKLLPPQPEHQTQPGRNDGSIGTQFN